MNPRFSLLSLACMLTPFTASAMDYTIKEPIVTKGEAELELTAFGGSDANAEKDGEHNLRVSAGYGVTDFWFTEIESEWSNDPGEKFTHEAVASENIFQLFPQGTYMVDVGLYAEYEFGTRHHAANELTFGPIFQSDIGKLRLTVNPFVSAEIGHNQESAPEFTYAVRAQYLWREAFNPAVEFYGQVGEIVAGPPLHAQSHNLGPTFSGSFSLHDIGLPGRLGYEAGILFGLTDEAPQKIYKGKLEYEFVF